MVRELQLFLEHDVGMLSASLLLPDTLVLYRGLAAVTSVHSARLPVYPSSYAIVLPTTMHSQPPASFATRPHVRSIMVSKLRVDREAHASRLFAGQIFLLFPHFY